MMKKKIFILFISFLLFSTLAFAETIKLKSGEVITGKIVDKTPGYIKVDVGKKMPVIYLFEEIATVDGKKSSPGIAQEATDPDTNAAILYKKASELISVSDDFEKKAREIIQSGIGENEVWLKETLNSNKDAIAEFKKASRLKECDFTFGKHIEDINAFEREAISPLNQMELRDLIILEGLVYEKESKLDLALENYFSVLRFASHFANQKYLILLNKVIAIGTEGVTLESLSRFIYWQRFSTQDYQNLLNTLISYKNSKTGLEDAFIEDRDNPKNSLRESLEQSKQEHLKFELSKERRKKIEAYYQKIFSEYSRIQDEIYRAQINSFKENRPEIHMEKFKQLQNDFKEKYKIAIPPEDNGPWYIWGILRDKNVFEQKAPSMIAGAMALLWVPKLADIVTPYYEASSELNVLITAVAIKLYETKNGIIPNNIEELIPNYISQIPEDPFNNFNPVKYIKTEKGWLVYSFGPDKKDNQGNGKFERVKKDKIGDIVFSSL